MVPRNRWAPILDRGVGFSRYFVSLEKLSKLVNDLIVDLFWTRVRLPAPPPNPTIGIIPRVNGVD